MCLIKYTGCPAVALFIVFMIKDKIINLFGGGIKSAKHGNSEVHFFETTKKIKYETSINQNLQQLIPIDITGLSVKRNPKMYQNAVQKCTTS
ncbi:hypothetical protein M947_11570 [Sulfurimonas hongkongensis]|uniref:Uncharacterized protein n=1 Tax=Sulfurimonas hongkongensis TaxID=1172190 RepID=T0KC71_9BACT|nr:hypothetical protein M947_11570 [Sulfurimonas hongkongensis]